METYVINGGIKKKKKKKKKILRSYQLLFVISNYNKYIKYTKMKSAHVYIDMEYCTGLNKD